MNSFRLKKRRCQATSHLPFTAYIGQQHDAHFRVRTCDAVSSAISMSMYILHEFKRAPQIYSLGSIDMFRTISVPLSPKFDVLKIYM